MSFKRSSQSGPYTTSVTEREPDRAKKRERVSVRSVSRSTIRFDTPDSKRRMENGESEKITGRKRRKCDNLVKQSRSVCV